MASDLTLMTSSRAVGARDVGHDRGGLGAVARPVHGAAGALDGLLQALEVDVEVAQRARP